MWCFLKHVNKHIPDTVQGVRSVCVWGGGCVGVYVRTDKTLCYILGLVPVVCVLHPSYPKCSEETAVSRLPWHIKKIVTGSLHGLTFSIISSSQDS